MEFYSNQIPFITLKDHNQNFKKNTKCSLIYPSESEVGLVSKHYLQVIINTVAGKSSVNQFRNTDIVENLFENLTDKPKHRFANFDIA